MKAKLLILLLMLPLAGCMTEHAANIHFLGVGKKYFINLPSNETADDSEYGAYRNEFTIIASGGTSWYLVEYVRGEQGRVLNGVGIVPTKKKRRIWLNIAQAISVEEAK